MERCEANVTLGMHAGGRAGITNTAASLFTRLDAQRRPPRLLLRDIDHAINDTLSSRCPEFIGEARIHRLAQ